ncbi:MAG: DUF3363 domain-containing protein [Aestuariivita sp.]|nr:DUF3363 domain-containing protein [Aestuariivita sp.]
MACGIADDVRDQTYVVIDAADGTAAYINVGQSDRLVKCKKDMIVTAHPASHTPHTNEELIKAHVRRLETTCKTGVSIAHQSDGT